MDGVHFAAVPALSLARALPAGRERRRVLLNTALACAAAFIILYATILNRTPGNYELILTPFAALSAARQQPELYRAMLMNVFLFFPLG